MLRIWIGFSTGSLRIGDSNGTCKIFICHGKYNFAHSFGARPKRVVNPGLRVFTTGSIELYQTLDGMQTKDELMDAHDPKLPTGLDHLKRAISQAVLAEISAELAITAGLMA